MSYYVNKGKKFLNSGRHFLKIYKPYRAWVANIYTKRTELLQNVTITNLWSYLTFEGVYNSKGYNKDIMSKGNCMIFPIG